MPLTSPPPKKAAHNEKFSTSMIDAKLLFDIKTDLTKLMTSSQLHNAPAYAAYTPSPNIHTPTLTPTPTPMPSPTPSLQSSSSESVSISNDGYNLINIY